MKKNNILYKTSIGYTPYISWLLLSLPIVFIFIVNIIYKSVSLEALLIISSIFSLIMFFRTTKEVIVREGKFEINYNIFFNLILKEKSVYYFTDIKKIELYDKKWSIELTMDFLPYPHRVGKKIIIHYQSEKKEIEQIKEIDINKNDIQIAVDLINKKLSKNG